MQLFVGLAVLALSGTVGASNSISTSSTEMGKAPEGLTGAEWKKMQVAMERDQYRLHPQGQGYYGRNHAQALRMTFSLEGFEVRPLNAEGQWRWGLRLKGYGYGDHLEPVSGAELVVIDNRIEYRRGDLVEWYVNDHRGLEQGFTLRQRPAGKSGDDPLQLYLTPTGDLRPRLTRDGKRVEWMEGPGKTVLRYSGLYAYDAMGRELLASMEVREGGIRLRVRDQGAVYPITIDPFIEQKKLTASDGAASDEFGISVSISGDTAIVGAEDGAAYIFERNQGGANNWGEVKKLTASDGAAGDFFGISVSISGDTAIVGAEGNDDNGSNSGSAYIFERNQGGANNWGEVQKLTAGDTAAFDEFGFSVSISGDTAIVGAVGGDDKVPDSGSAYIFERNQGGANNWGEVKKLTASDGAAGDEFGISVSISGDTAIVGAVRDDDKGVDSGSGYIFERNQGGANNWGEVKKLTASDGTANDLFGESVAISGDTAIVGAGGDDDKGGSSGSAYVFRSGGAAPFISGLSQISGQPTTLIVISGSNFGLNKGAVRFDTKVAKVQSWSDTTISAIVPKLNVGSYLVTVKTKTGVSNAITFTIPEQFLGFPLANRTPQTVPNSYFDHSLVRRYCADGLIVTYEGLQAGSPLGHQDCSPLTYKNPSQFRYGGLSYDGHPGYDFRTKDADQDPVNGKISVYAVALGKVAWGNAKFCTLIINHLNGYSTVYLHLDQRLVKPGQDVVEGQLIGISGECGAAKGNAHLHFEVKKNGVAVDPYGWEGCTGCDPYGMPSRRLWK